MCLWAVLWILFKVKVQDFSAPNVTLDFPFQLRREKIDLENTLEQEQEALVNRLWKRMDKLEAEKRWGMILYVHFQKSACFQQHLVF